MININNPRKLLNGYNINGNYDNLLVNLSTYQATQYDENNQTTPKILPYINYSFGEVDNKYTNYQNYLEFYNIFREKNTTVHSENQQKISHNILTNNEIKMQIRRLSVLIANDNIDQGAPRGSYINILL